MTTGLLIMTKKELDRIAAIKNVVEKRIEQSDVYCVLLEKHQKQCEKFFLSHPKIQGYKLG